MNKTWAKWLLAILNKAGYEEGDCLIVAVSGGPDSLALLHRLRDLLGPAALHVAHLDHGIRPSSAQEAQYVSQLARSWGIPFTDKRVNVPELADHKGWSLEEAARNARYDFLARVAQKTGVNIVAVGHNADDQAETILLHLLRGSGLSGLRGMQPLGPFPGVPGLKLLRPFLNQSRADIEAYCREHGLQPLEDESNRDPAYLRNRIRHQLLPQLKAYNPRIKEQLVQLAAIATAEDDLVSALLDASWPELVSAREPEWMSLDRDRFRVLPTAMQRRAIRRTVELLYPDVSDLSFKTVEQALDLANRQESGTETKLPGELTLLVDYHSLLFARDTADIPTDLPQMPPHLPAGEALPLPVPGQVELANGWFLSARSIEAQSGKDYVQADPWTAAIELPRSESLFVRSRRPGERMQPMGMDGRTSSLQDIMVNRKIASRLRENWPLLVTGEHVVWLPGHIIDHRARITYNPRRLVRLTCRRTDDKS
ncbi:MAG: tRNA lysidine(34) synthetase TilS [Candidatus Promineifilaceae bacterium]